MCRLRCYRKTCCNAIKLLPCLRFGIKHQNKKSKDWYPMFLLSEKINADYYKSSRNRNSFKLQLFRRRVDQEEEKNQWKFSKREKCCKMNVNVWSRGMGGHEYRFNIQIATHIRRPHWQIIVFFSGISQFEKIKNM